MTVPLTDQLAVGLDLGTQGVRVLCVNADGVVRARARHDFPPTEVLVADEQEPDTWWAAAVDALSTLTRELGRNREAIAAIAVSATSGTLVALDAAHRPVVPALMYSDRRSGPEAAALNERLSHSTDPPALRFDSSFGLPKAIWLRNANPDAFRSVRHLGSQGDFLVGCLSGEFGVSDPTQTLKLGFDVAGMRWPAFIDSEPGLGSTLLPKVVETGTIVGAIRPEVAAATGLPHRTQVAVGVTDGVAGQLACDPAPGRWATVLGTTLVWKGMSSSPLVDPQGRIYNHRGPGGTWLPGAAGNCGGRIISTWFGGVDWQEWDRHLPEEPTGLLVYPLVGVGERYPFRNAQAEGFVVGGSGTRDKSLYAACLEGVAFVERWGYDVVRELGEEVRDSIATTGGGARTGAWLRMRANVLGQTVTVPTESEPAFGAAIIAASALAGERVQDAGHRMVKWSERVEPDPRWTPRYEEQYARFRAACRDRGYA